MTNPDQINREHEVNILTGDALEWIEQRYGTGVAKNPAWDTLVEGVVGVLAGHDPYGPWLREVNGN